MEIHAFGWHCLIFLSVKRAIRNALLGLLKLSAGHPVYVFVLELAHGSMSYRFQRDL
jgi:hypothetical protein